MAAGFVEHAAIISGWPAHAMDVILSRRLPEYLLAMSPEQRSEMDAAHAVIHRAAKAYKAGSNVRRRTSDIEEIEFSAPSSHEINTKPSGRDARADTAAGAPVGSWVGCGWLGSAVGPYLVYRS